MKFKKIIIVYIGGSRKESPYRFNWIYTTSPGLHYVNATLLKQGFETDIINTVDENLTIDEVIGKLNELNPDIVLFNQFIITREEIKQICSSLPTNIIRGIGGHDATLHSQSLSEQEFARQYAHVDFVWQGECENGFADFLRSFNKGNEPVRINNIANRVQNLDHLPVLKHNDYSSEMAFLVTSRGCLTSGCDYCTTPSLYPDGWRARSVSHVIEELRNIKESGRFYIIITDDNFFGMNEKNFERGLDIIHHCKELGLMVFPETTVPQILRAEKLGVLNDFTGTVIKVFIGVENGDPNALRKLGKKVNIEKHMEQSAKALDALYRHEISPHLCYINFNPETTCDELKNSARFLHENQEEASLFFYLRSSLGIFEGTRIYSKYLNTESNFKIDYGYDYNFFDNDTANVSAMLWLLSDHAWMIDFLHYETTNLIYMNQLIRTPVGGKYAAIRKKLNDQNYEFFINAIEISRNKGSQAAIYDLVGDFKAKVNRSIVEYKQLIPQIVSQSKYIIREPLEYVDAI